MVAVADTVAMADMVAEAEEGAALLSLSSFPFWTSYTADPAWWECL